MLVIKQEKKKKKKTLPKFIPRRTSPMWVSLVQAQAISYCTAPNLENKAVTWMDWALISHLSFHCPGKAGRLDKIKRLPADPISLSSLELRPGREVAG